MIFAGPVSRLIDRLSRLPGIGPKSAQRIAFFLLKEPEETTGLAEAMLEVKDKIKFCSICYNITDQDICGFCQNNERDSQKICIVEEALDIAPIEKTGEYKGRYHVLQGAISPIDGVGPDDLKINELIERLKKEPLEEVIIATNPNVEGEATALYLAKLIKPMGIKVSRLASGLPVGGDLEYADEVTLGRAFEGRREI